MDEPRRSALGHGYGMPSDEARSPRNVARGFASAGAGALLRWSRDRGV